MAYITLNDEFECFFLEERRAGKSGVLLFMSSQRDGHD